MCFVDNDWFNLVNVERQKTYFEKLESFIADERLVNIVHPPEELVFNAFRLTPPQCVKVCIVGQRPYHDTHVDVPLADGLSFSVPHDIPPSFSLQEVLKESGRSLENGNLTSWAEQGVLLLNLILTVRHMAPDSHAEKGWERFTSEVIHLLSSFPQRIVFLLWGKCAEELRGCIDEERHLVLASAHPSSMTHKSQSPFRGCNHFHIANDDIISHGGTPIEWHV
jgi:uracil-DNA glycosylase